MGRTSTGVMAGVLPVLMVFGFFYPGAQPTTSTSTASTSTTTASAPAPARVAAVPTICRTPARRGFWPTRSKVQNVARRVPVLAVGRDRYGIPRTPPLSSLGKRSFGWDKKGPKPGSRRGTVRFNAHTYPDGSALGNRMLRSLWVGSLIVVRNSYGKTICYRVTRRVQISPYNRTELKRYYTTRGTPKLGIVVCSGTRLGPGRWTKRTIWYAYRVTS